MTIACRQAVRAVARGKVGKYGGLYVCRDEDTDGQFIVHDNDDPETLPDNLDAFAHVTPTGVCAMGRARNYLFLDGSVKFPLQ